MSHQSVVLERITDVLPRHDVDYLSLTVYRAGLTASHSGQLTKHMLNWFARCPKVKCMSIELNAKDLEFLRTGDVRCSLSRVINCLLSPREEGNAFRGLLPHGWTVILARPPGRKEMPSGGFCLMD